MTSVAMRQIETDGPDLSLESGRQTPRLEIALQVRISDASGNAARSYLSRDLSNEGLFIRTTHPLAIGARVKLEFVLPKVRVLKFAGEVVRQLGAHEVASPGEAGMAIRFRDGVKADADALRAFLVGHGVK